MTAELEAVLPQLPHKVNACYFPNQNTNYHAVISDDINEIVYLSQDVAHMILAKMYMYIGQYEMAKTHLEDIVNNGYYALRSNGSISSIPEVIFAIYSPDNISSGGTSAITEVIPLFSYMDVLLSLAECTSDETYLNQITTAKDIALSATEWKQKMKDTFKETLLETGGYFAFLKRSGLAISEIGLTNDCYLLFPIPQHELALNPLISQNPGY